jgi:ABC-2 type transport system permease protein
VRALPWELRKLLAQTRLRVALAVCVLGPPLFAAVLTVQPGTPKDTLLGRQVHESGFALPLVALGFLATWAFPLMTSIVAGDIFSAEDAQGTWPSLLTRSCSRGQLFTAKVTASVVAACALLAVTAASSLLSGLALAGDRPLTSLSGDPVGAGRAVRLVAVSWAAELPALLAFTALACLLSVVSRSSLVGVAGPFVLGLLMQLLGLVGALGRGTDLLLTTPFLAWHGLVRTHPYYGPLWQGALVSLVWAVLCLVAARRVLLARDIT